jgi:pimeloyl-ACP methyl ester carboxylesterase
MTANPSYHDGWAVVESGPADAEHAALLLPGGLCSAAFYEDVLADPRMREAPVRWVATTIPGYGGTRPLGDLRFESYAESAARLAADLGCDVVVGLSMGANLAIEMLASGRFEGPAVLLSPAFSREDEFKELALMDRLGRVPGVGGLAWWLLLKGLPREMRKELPAERAEALAADMVSTTAGFCRPAIIEYFAYLDRADALVSRLCDSAAKAWVAFGDADGEVGLTDEQRSALEACPHVELVTFAGSGHYALVDQPAIVAELILQAVGSLAPA